MLTIPGRKLNARQKKIVAIWNELGVKELTQDHYDELDELEDTPTAVKSNNVKMVTREAELVLLSLARGGVPLKVTCKECGNVFQTNYNYERYCTHSCRAKAMEKVGIVWDYEKPDEDRYFPTDPPSTINPATYEKLLSWAKAIVEQAEANQPLVQEVPPVVAEIPKERSHLDELFDMM